MAILGTLNVVFAGYMLVQARVLFGGADYVAATTGLSLAEYARRGFFVQAFTVASTLATLLALRTLFVDRDQAGERQFRWLAGALMLLTAPVIGSAVMRMLVYVASFGYSTERVYTLIGMGWTVGVMVWFARTVLRGDPRGFAAGIVVSAWVTLLAVNVANPDAWVARGNVMRAAAGQRYDFFHAFRQQSGDALPVVMRALNQSTSTASQQLLESADRCAQLWALVNRWSNPKHSRVSAWTVSRARVATLRDDARLLNARIGCEGWTPPAPASR